MGDSVTFSEEGTFSGIAYTGGEITNHYWWDRLVIDLESMKIPSNVPVLVEHDIERIAGKCSKVEKADGLSVEGILYPEDVSEDATRLRKLSKAGHAWQMSIWSPREYDEEVQPGVEVTVNGQTFIGPLTISRIFITKLMDLVTLKVFLRPLRPDC